MKRIDYAIRLISRLRSEKAVPLGRYAVLLYLAKADRPEGVRMSSIQEGVGADTSPSGTVQHAVKAGLVSVRVEREEHLRREWHYYRLTEAGQALAADLLNPRLTVNLQ